MFSHPFPHAFGLDISDLSVKLVQLRNKTRVRRRPSFDVVTARSLSLPHGLIENGEILQPETVRKYLLHLLGLDKSPVGGGFKPVRGEWVVASIPEPQSFIKLIRIKKPQKTILEEDIISIAQKHIPFDPDSYFIEWQVLPSAEVTEYTDILIGATQRQTANTYTYLLESVGLGVVALELETLATSRAMITVSKEYQHEARAVLDLGATRSTLIIFDNERVQFSKTVPFSGEGLTSALVAGLDLSYEEAERIKIESGLDYGNGRGKAFAIMQAEVAQLVTDMKKAIDFYYSHFPDTSPVTHITMCGGTANLQRLDSVLSEQLGIEAKPGKPWKNLLTKQDITISQAESQGYATAIGLALRAADNPFFTQDLM